MAERARVIQGFMCRMGRKGLEPILFGRSDGNGFGLIGGGVKEGEEKREAMVREGYEEAGVRFALFQAGEPLVRGEGVRLGVAEVQRDAVVERAVLLFVVRQELFPGFRRCPRQDGVGRGAGVDGAIEVHFFQGIVRGRREE